MSVADVVAGASELGFGVDPVMLEKWLAERNDVTHPMEVALACACAAGDRRALERFEAEYFREIAIAMTRIKAPATLDEVSQALREKLFVGPSARIIQYSGRGDLRSWFRTTVIRHLLNLATRTKEIALEDRILEALPENETDQTNERTRAELGPLVRDVLVESVQSLEARERTILRFAICDGLSIDALARIYNVHRATAARWVTSAKEKLEVTVRERLAARLQGREEALTSVMRLFASHLDVSLRRHLATG